MFNKKNVFVLVDLSLYKDESQLQKLKKASKRTSSSPSRRSPKQAKKDESGEAEKTPKKTKGKIRNKVSKKVMKTASEKNKTRKVCVQILTTRR